MERRDAIRRRQLLQLDQPISSIRARNRAADEARKQEETKNVLQGLLGDYTESDDEEQVSNSQLEEPNEETVSVLEKNSPNPTPLSSIPSIHSHPDPEKSLANIDQSEDSIEEALKSFMSEINALPVTSIHNDSLIPTDEFVKSEKELISTQISNLNSDWEKYWHNENACHYYYNKVTGETRWEHEIHNISSDCNNSKELSLTLVSSKVDTNREVDSQTTNIKDDFIQNISLRVPPSDSPLHGRSRDAYGRLSNLAPIVTHLKLERHQIEFATRMHDWQVGALNSQYFDKVILEGLERLLRGVEEQVSPAGWVCKWKTETQTYNWIHLQTNQVSSTYPSQSLYSSPNNHSADDMVIGHQEYATISSSFYAAPSSLSTPNYPISLSALSTDHSISTTSAQNLPPLPPLPPPPPSHPAPKGDLDADIKPIYSEDDGTNKSSGSCNIIQGVQPAGEKKRKKEKEPLISGFKNKKMATLVEKWKAAEDFLFNTDWDEVRRHQGSPDPESWIKEQIESGEAANNPNLEPIKGNWRQRIRNKKSDKE